MMMFLTILFTSVIALAVCSLMFARTAPRETPHPELRPDPRLALDPPKFFAGDLARPAEPKPVPLEVLLSHIDRHVRLEQAAAETFLDVPTPESLHSRTASPFVN
jgi:hypothetical protein